MDVRFAHLCDYASISREGKLSVMGIFSNINVGELPARHPFMCLAFELELSYAEFGRKHTVEIKGVDADGGNQFLTMKGEMVINAPEQPRRGERPRIGQIMQLHNMQFKRTGAHDIHIFVNGDLKQTVTFLITRRERPTRAPETPPLDSVP